MVVILVSHDNVSYFSFNYVGYKYKNRISTHKSGDSKKKRQKGGN